MKKYIEKLSFIDEGFVLWFWLKNVEVVRSLLYFELFNLIFIYNLRQTFIEEVFQIEIISISLQKMEKWKIFR